VICLFFGLFWFSLDFFAGQFIYQVFGSLLLGIHQLATNTAMSAAMDDAKKERRRSEEGEKKEVTVDSVEILALLEKIAKTLFMFKKGDADGALACYRPCRGASMAAAAATTVAAVVVLRCAVCVCVCP
jgi:hypothetical protein